MNGIFGLFLRDGRPVPHQFFENLSSFQRNGETEQTSIFRDEGIHLSVTHPSFTCVNNIASQEIFEVSSNIQFISIARLDNREDIEKNLPFSSHKLSQLADSEIIRLAYIHWGENCTEQLYGDWSFAVWHKQERRLFLARDHFGITSLYYYVDENVFAFASDRTFLLSLNLVPIKLDELYLAQVLVFWTAYHGERTVHSQICRLPPAHRLTITPNRLIVQQYWYLEQTPELKLANRSEYCEAFREQFNEAVKSRINLSPMSHNKNEIISSTLSGGLDSSSVTVVAADILSHEGRSINAYTSVPVYDTEPYLRNHFGNEYSLAEATARLAGNINLAPISAENYSPILAIRHALSIHNEPGHAAGTYYWLLKLMCTVQATNSKVLLIGQFGNAGISWTGDIFSQSLLFQIRRLGVISMIKNNIMRSIPPVLIKPWHRFRLTQEKNIVDSAINPEFADRLSIYEQQFNDPLYHLKRTALVQRGFLMPGRNIIGSLWAEIGNAFNIQISDPTADVRVLKFVFSVPDHVFIDPKSGIDRWLIRESMKGRLPDEVRLNQKRGHQAADLVPRLRACADDVINVLEELARGPAAEFVDVPYMKKAWEEVRTHDTPQAFGKSVLVLTRGIMTGLFVNGFYANDCKYGS